MKYKANGHEYRKRQGSRRGEPAPAKTVAGHNEPTRLAQGGVLLEDPPLKFPQLRPWFQAEFLN